MDIIPQKHTGLRRWQAKKLLSARHLNEAVDLLSNVFKPGGSRQSMPVGNVFVRRLYVRIPYNDVILCSYDADDEDGQVVVAKPPLLQRSPFDFALNSQGARTRNVFGVVITYTFTDPTDGDAEADPPTDPTPLIRTATDDDDNTEDQVITPAYVNGDTIFALSGIKAGTGVWLEGPPPDSIPRAVRVELIDLNLDGRAWAVKT